MIARIWHGRTQADKADEYSAFLERVAVKDYRGTPGNQGVLFLRCIEGDVADFQLISLWESLEIISNFAGDDIAKAVYYPEDDGFLLEKEPYVVHYEVFAK